MATTEQYTPDTAPAHGCAPPEPGPWHFALLGVTPGSPLDVVEAAYDALSRQFDPRTVAPEYQRWAITVQDALNEAMALIYDAATLGKRVAA